MYTDLAKRTLSTFGLDQRLTKLQSELFELGQAINHYLEGKDTLDHVLEEIADVTLISSSVVEQSPLEYKDWLCLKAQNLNNILKDKEKIGEARSIEQRRQRSHDKQCCGVCNCSGSSTS